MKLFDVPQKLAHLIRFRLPTHVLQVQGTVGLGMFVNVMAPADPIQPVAKSFRQPAYFVKPEVVRARPFSQSLRFRLTLAPPP